MKKLIDAFRATPTPAMRAKLVAYMQLYPMAVCLLVDADIVFLTEHGFL